MPNFTLEEWTDEDVKAYSSYLSSLARADKEPWTRRILNTSLPLLAIPFPTLKKIAKEIARGNFLSFLQKDVHNTFEDTIVQGALIGKIADFDTAKHYLLRLANRAESWATCDSISFGINNENKQQWWDLSANMTKDSLPFVRRIGVLIMFKFIKNGGLEDIFEQIKCLYCEKEYYVNMAVAWLMAECFVHDPTATLPHLLALNDTAKRMAIQKCRDSFRVSAEDKELLKSLKYQMPKA